MINSCLTGPVDSTFPAATNIFAGNKMGNERANSRLSYISLCGGKWFFIKPLFQMLLGMKGIIRFEFIKIFYQGKKMITGC
jgi:hypothetical protein